ncbi:hypothetical protein [Planococcus lenghuensis]|uniref:hypothetical protein n=1 Tax=Planococcus lenghuensis TaxID=2213202 RepID=UPI0012EC31BA|nr:hypothetical protein [Planococcus lenghuensis]
MSYIVLFVPLLVIAWLIVITIVGVDSPGEKRKMKRLIGLMAVLSVAYITMDLLLF